MKTKDILKSIKLYELLMIWNLKKSIYCYNQLFRYLHFKGTLSPKIIFEYVKQSWPLVIRSLAFCSRNSKKERKYVFSKISRDSVYLKNEYRKRKVYLKNEYRKRKLLSIIVTGKEFGSQMLLPINILLKSHEISRGTFGNPVYSDNSF